MKLTSVLLVIASLTIQASLSPLSLLFSIKAVPHRSSVSLQVKLDDLLTMSSTDLSEFCEGISSADSHLRNKLAATLRERVRRISKKAVDKQEYSALYDLAYAIGRCKPKSIEDIELLCKNKKDLIREFGSWSLVEYAKPKGARELMRVKNLASGLMSDTIKQVRENARWVLETTDSTWDVPE